MESIKQKILELTSLYASEKLATQPFVAGKTYIPVSQKILDASDAMLLTEATLDLWLTSGRFSQRFEKELSSVFSSRVPSLFVNSGSSANLIAISSLGISGIESTGFSSLKPGDEVITVAAAFPSTVAPIIQNGWKPVFIDIDPETLNTTPDLIAKAKSKKTRAVVLAHTLGNPYRADLVMEFCSKEKLFLVEDCCDALGATINSKPVGSFGHFATASFYPAHHITTGEGGAVVTKDPRLRKIAASLRDWGRDCWCETGVDNTCGKRFEWKMGDLPLGYDHKYIYTTLGYNLKATDLQAALGCSQLKKLSLFVEMRKSNWQYLYDQIKSSPILSVSLYPIQATKETSPSWFGFPITVAPGISRIEIVRFLEANRVGSRPIFAGNLVRQPAFRNVERKIMGTLKNTDYIMENTFWIGIHPGLQSQHLSYMLQVLEDGVKAQVRKAA